MPAKTLDELTGSDVFDSREVIARIEELESREPDEDRDALWFASDLRPEPLTDDEHAELATLRAFAEEAKGYAADWQYGEGFIRDSYFVEYAQELADDIGAVDSDAGWPSAYIDWQAAADALQQDYSAVELEGITFWTR